MDTEYDRRARDRFTTESNEAWTDGDWTQTLQDFSGEI